MGNWIRNIVVSILMLFISPCVAQDMHNQFYPSLFQDEDLLKITLKFDITSHIRKKSEIYSPGELVIYTNLQDSSSYTVKCRARGNYRKDNCHFPPVMLNFKPDTLHTQDGYITKLKLVSHCQGSKLYKQNLLKEYIAYKLWQLISPYALRTRLVDINYYDSGDKKRNSQHLGFFIEPMQMMTNRTNTFEIKGEYFKDEEINELDADRVALFNYMIGNTDWRIKSGHNIKYIKRFGHRREEATAIPYDFDHAGFINAPYAQPATWSTAKTVTERDYTGRCRNTDENYELLIKDFLEVEDQMYQTIKDFKHLSPKIRKQLTKYIALFYKELKKPKAFIRSLNNSCMEKY